MAYVIFTANGDEVDRRELTAAVTIGRAQDADIPVRDILLSRNHCKLEPGGDGQWIVTDLGSKNGTYLGYRQVTRHTLKDGEELRIGRTRVTFRAGAFEPPAPGTKRREVVRPADPTEALAGTVAGFLLVEPGEVERQAGAPVPQPRPPEPSAFAAEDVYGMLNEIASSSWDSIMAQASRPLVMERPLPRPSGYRPVPAARRTRVAFSLQAPAGDESATAAAGGEPARAGERARRRWALPSRTRRQVAVGVVSACATALMVGAWAAAVNRAPRPIPPAMHQTPQQHPVPEPKPNLPSFPTRAPSALQDEPPQRIDPAPSAHPPAALPPPTPWSADDGRLHAAARTAVLHFLLTP